MSRRTVSASNAAAVGPYSHATWAGDLLFCSGQTPLDPGTGKLVDGNVVGQTHQCFDNLFEVLEAAGLGSDDVVSVNVYLTDMGDFGQMKEIYTTRFSSPYPARTTIGCASLPLGARIEIALTAKRQS
ncbi:RidA family protein [Rhizobium laguerreae]|uniref:RidA family protein n=1 Tax=Rhizobium laguerreae TaxID=1076926 RepID=UPI001440F2D4|nr:Rid family detoxifying hydrolase [Rhizobium laguerreae]NKM22986.1 RidA family protein [Rhizobium laguerreae]